MGRSVLEYRRRFGAETEAEAEVEDEDEILGRLEAENGALKEQVAEAEGWYRLLQADHATLRDRCGRQGFEMINLRAALNRLEVENKELRDLSAHREREAEGVQTQPEDATMNRFQAALTIAKKYRWAAVAALTVGTLLARDPGVNDVLSRAWDRARDSADRVKRDDSGFVRYAAMVHARDQLDEARKAYNEREAHLKGDALLEAQDRLRAAKARFLRARLAFLPELARRCEAANIPLPHEAAENLAALKTEAAE